LFELYPKTASLKDKEENVLAFSRSNATKYHIILFNVKIMTRV
jgi:hypothetical protein